MAIGNPNGIPFCWEPPVKTASDIESSPNLRISADGGVSEFSNGCLDGRVFSLVQASPVGVLPSLLVVPQSYKSGKLYAQLPNARVNHIPNNSMFGASGGVIPSGWTFSIGAASGVSLGYSASGQATAEDGTLVDYIDFTFSGTATASGFLNLRPNASPSTIASVSGQSWNASVYFQLISGSVTSISPTYQLQETTSGGTFIDGSNITGLGSLTTSLPLRRYNVTRDLNTSGTVVTCRWGHSIVSGTSYNYTLRIASPQLENLSSPTSVIRTVSGAVYAPYSGAAPGGPLVASIADFTVSRNTTATRVTSSGLIESVASGVPRIDWLGQSCPGLLVEASGTNFARWVNQMTSQDTPTASGGMTITTGSTDFLAPNGTSGSITKYVGGAASGTSQGAYYSGGGITVTASGQHTFSLFVKRGATNPLTFCALGIENFAGGSGTIFSYFNLASGTALTAGASVQDYGNGWYRLISAPYTIASTDLTGTLTFFMAEGNGDLSWPASGALNLTAYTWGAQLEAGSIATTYIPTTTTTASRAADVISASGALVSGLIGQTEGTIYAEVDFRNLQAGRFLSINAGTTANRILLVRSAANVVSFTVTVSSIAQYSVNSSALASGVHKFAAGYKQNDFAFYVDGSLVGTSSSGNVPACTQIDLGNETGSFNYQDRIRAAALYTTRLSNDQLAELTRL